MSKSEAIIIGWINKGKPADCGETMKNQCIVSMHNYIPNQLKKDPWMSFPIFKIYLPTTDSQFL